MQRVVRYTKAATIAWKHSIIIYRVSDYVVKIVRLWLRLLISHNFTTIHTTVQQFTQLYNNSHNCTTIHTTVQQFTQLYNNSHNCTTIHTTVQQFTVATNWYERVDFFNSVTLNVHIVLQGNKYIVELLILLQTGRIHLVNLQS